MLRYHTWILLFDDLLYILHKHNMDTDTHQKILGTKMGSVNYMFPKCWIYKTTGGLGLVHDGTYKIYMFASLDQIPILNSKD